MIVISLLMILATFTYNHIILDSQIAKLKRILKINSKSNIHFFILKYDVEEADTQGIINKQCQHFLN